MNANTLRRRECDRGTHHEAAKEGHHTNKTAREAAKTAAPRAAATWTSERVAQLRSCASAGLTCSQIAGEIGVSRNAVIGKMNRLGLSRPRSARTSAPEAKRAAGRNGSPNITRLFSQHRILMQLPPEPQDWSAVVSIHAGRGCSLLDLSPGKCRWPINEPGAQDFCFCGNQQVEGLPYCMGHARLAYKSTARSSNGARV